MQKQTSFLVAKTLLGLKVRTSYQNELNPLTSQIIPCVGRYWQEKIADTIPFRKNPGVLHAAYCEYDNDYTGAYSYFIGEEVSSIENMPSGLEILTIPAGRYTKFTTPMGIMPFVVIHGWQQIWAMTEAQINGKRRYDVDFEIYDERAKDPNQTILDIYLGVST